MLLGEEKNDNKSFVQQELNIATNFASKLINNLEKDLVELEKSIDENFLEMNEKIKSVRQDFESAVKEIKSEIHELKIVLTKQNMTHEAIQFEASIEEVRLGFDRNKSVIACGEYLQGNLFIKKLKNKRVIEFLGQFKQYMNESKEPTRNGISNRGRPRIDHSEILITPEYFTGLLAHRIRISEVPNYHLFMHTLPLLLNVLRNKNLMENFGGPIKEAALVARKLGNQLVILMDSSVAFVEKILEKQKKLNEYLSYVERRSEELSKRKQRELFDASWENTKSIRQAMLGEDFVGAEKFALSNLIQQKPYFPNIGIELFKWIEKSGNIYQAISSISSIFKEKNDKLKLEQFFYKQFKKLSPIDLKPKIKGTLPQILQLIRDNGLRKTINYYYDVPCYGINKEFIIIELFQKTIIDNLAYRFLSKEEYKIRQKEHLYKELFCCQIFVDINDSRYDFSSILDYTTTHYQNSVIKYEDFSKIGNFSAEMQERYSDRIKQYITSYFEFVEGNIEGESFKSIHKPFFKFLRDHNLHLDYEELKDADVLVSYILNNFPWFNGMIRGQVEMLPSLNSQLIPLAFPKSLLKYWNKKIHLTKEQLNSFVPCYDFKCSPDKNSYQLSLEYLYISSGSPKKYASIILAEFNPLTIYSFWKINTKNESGIGLPNLNEFLLTMMYGQAMPNNHTYQLENQMISVCESPFLGLFKILQDKPDSMLKYDSTKYNLESEKKEIANWLRKALFKIGEDYFSVNSELRQKKVDEKLNKLSEQYNKAYHLLLAHTRLVSHLKENELRLLIWRSLKIAPPQVAQNCFKHSGKVVIKEFRNKLHASRSDKYRLLKQSMTELDRLLEKL